MKFTGENLTLMGFPIKAKRSVNQCGGGRKRKNEQDIESPN